MMTKKTPDSVGDYTQKAIEEFYDTKLTDKQWKLLVEYASDPDPDYETTEDLILDFIEKIELLEEVSDEYEKMWLETHGNPYPFTKDGVNVEEDND
jgi:peptide subunit release factor RF-3